MAVFAVSIVAAQNNSKREMSVEESYLQESIEMMIIRETIRSNSRDSKIIGLGYISEAINRGSTNDEIRQILQELALEGTSSITRENGRVVNNYPDIRRQAVKYLGQLGTEEAKSSLLTICQVESEPMVLQEVIKSLGEIGTNENNETIELIVWIVKKFDNTKPDNLLAIATIEAIEKISKNNNVGFNSHAIQLLLRFTEGPYAKSVQERAKQSIAGLRSNN
jgi:HEAT repeat protein